MFIKTLCKAAYSLSKALARLCETADTKVVIACVFL